MYKEYKWQPPEGGKFWSAVESYGQIHVRYTKQYDGAEGLFSAYIDINDGADVDLQVREPRDYFIQNSQTDNWFSREMFDELRPCHLPYYMRLDDKNVDYYMSSAQFEAMSMKTEVDEMLGIEGIFLQESDQTGIPIRLYGYKNDEEVYFLQYGPNDELRAKEYVLLEYYDPIKK